jgi:RimJ/RimL family protein N-acetyltransferase
MISAVDRNIQDRDIQDRNIQNRSVSGDGLLLRPWTAADAAQVKAAAVDPAISILNPIEAASAADWCLARGDWSDGTHASWAIADPAHPERLLGSMSLFHVDRDQLDCEAGYWVVPAYRNIGVASRALRLASEFAAETLQLRRITLYHAVGNLGSCGVAQRAGYALEGIHRQSHRYGDGIWRDEHSHARLLADQQGGLT